MLDRFRADYQDRAIITNFASLGINALIGIVKLILGVCLLSGWFITNALYYLILCAARGQALHRYSVAKVISEPVERFNAEKVVFRRGGIFLCLLGISYLLVSLRMYVFRDAVVFGGTAVFLVATVSFIKLGSAIYGISANRHLKGPIVSTLKLFSFTDALVSIVVTQYTLLTMTGSPHALESSALFGMGCSLVFVILGIYMLKKRMVGNDERNSPITSL